MAYVPVPKDLTAVKEKVMFNLTKRQLICFGCGAVIGLPLFFLTRGALGTSLAAIIMIFILMPFLLLGLYEKNGQPMEKVAKNIIETCFLRPKVRPYQTRNLYSLLEKQEKLDKEVYNIVENKKTHGIRTKTN